GGLDYLKVNSRTSVNQATTTAKDGSAERFPPAGCLHPGQSRSPPERPSASRPAPHEGDGFYTPAGRTRCSSGSGPTITSSLTVGCKRSVPCVVDIPVRILEPDGPDGRAEGAIHEAPRRHPGIPDEGPGDSGVGIRHRERRVALRSRHQRPGGSP